MGIIKEINIKNPTYNFFDDMINITKFDLDLLKIDKKSYKNIRIYYIGYITIKNIDYLNIHSVNPLYLIFDKVDGYIEGSNGYKYLIFASIDEVNIQIYKYTKLWNKIKNLIEKISDKTGKYGKEFIKVKFDSDDNLSLNKLLKLHTLWCLIDVPAPLAIIFWEKFNLTQAFKIYICFV